MIDAFDTNQFIGTMDTSIYSNVFQYDSAFELLRDRYPIEIHDVGIHFKAED